MRDDVRDLSLAGVQKFARPFNRSFVARTPRFEENARGIAQFAQGLTRGLTTLEMAEADKMRADGLEAAQAALAEAEAGSETTAMAFAKAVQNDEIPESANPYWRTGYAKGIAQSLASRWQGEAQAAITRAFQETPLSAAAEGAPPAPPNPSEITKQTLDGIWEEMNKANPEMAENAWFQKEFSRQRTQVESQLADFGLRMQEERTRQDNNANRIVLLHDRLTKGMMADSAEAIADIEGWYRENIVLAGVKNPRAFFGEGVHRAFASILAAQGAEAAQDFVLRAGDVKLGTDTFAEGSEARKYRELSRRAQMAVDEELSESKRNEIDNVRDFKNSFRNGDVWREIAMSRNSVEAMQKVEDLKVRLFSGEVPGVPSELADEAWIDLQSVARQLSRPEAESMQQIEEAELALREGRLSDVERILDSTDISTKAKLAIMEEVQGYKASVGQFMDRNPSYKRASKSLMGLLTTESKLNDYFTNMATAQDAAMEEMEGIEQALIDHRDALMKLPEAERAKYVSEKVVPQMREMEKDIRAKWNKKKVAHDQSFEKVKRSILTGEDASKLIEQGDFSEREIRALHGRNRVVQDEMLKSSAPVIADDVLSPIKTRVNEMKHLLLEVGLAKGEVKRQGGGMFDSGDGDAESQYKNVKLTEQAFKLMDAGAAAAGEQIEAEINSFVGSGVGESPEEVASKVRLKRLRLERNAQRNIMELLVRKGTSEEDFGRYVLTGDAPQARAALMRALKMRDEYNEARGTNFTIEEIRYGKGRDLPTKDGAGQEDQEQTDGQNPLPSTSDEPLKVEEDSAIGIAAPVNGRRHALLDEAADAVGKTFSAELINERVKTHLQAKVDAKTFGLENDLMTSPVLWFGRFKDRLRAQKFGEWNHSYAIGQIPDEQGPSPWHMRQSYSTELANEMAKDLGPGAMRRNAIIDDIVNERQVDKGSFVIDWYDERESNLTPETMMGLSGAGWLVNKYRELAHSSTREDLWRRQSHPHPYALQFEAISRLHRGVSNAKEWVGYARKNAFDIVTKAKAEGHSATDVVQVAVDAYGFMGIDWRGLQKGVIRTHGASKEGETKGFDPAQHRHLIPWQWMPLFSNFEEFESTVGSDQDWSSFLSLLGIDSSQSDAVMEAQILALERLKLDA